MFRTSILILGTQISYISAPIPYFSKLNFRTLGVDQEIQPFSVLFLGVAVLIIFRKSQLTRPIMLARIAVVADSHDDLLNVVLLALQNLLVVDHQIGRVDFSVSTRLKNDFLEEEFWNLYVYIRVLLFFS